MLDWISRHLAGWQVFLPAIAGASLLTVRIPRTRRPHLLPWGVAVPWVAALIGLYVTSGADRFWYFDRTRWTWMVATLVLASAIPFLVLTILATSRWARAQREGRAVVATALTGVATIPLTNITAWLIASLFFSLSSGN